MALRISGGTLKGNIIVVPKVQQVRPTSERVREAIFSKILADIKGGTFLDICSGSGVMSIEAISRGASFASLVEKNRRCVSVIRENFKKCKIPKDKFRIFSCDAKKIKIQKVDIVFLDPPYIHEPKDWIESVETLVSKMMIYEHSTRVDVPAETKFLSRFDERKYGDTKVSFYVVKNP